MDGAQRHDDRMLAVHANLQADRGRLPRQVGEVDLTLNAIWRAADIWQ